MSQPGHPGFEVRRGRHAAGFRSWLNRPWRRTLLIVTAVLVAAGGVAVAAPVRRLLDENRGATQAQGVGASTPGASQAATATPASSPTGAIPSISAAPKPSATRPPPPASPVGPKGWPNAANTGVPAGIALSTYSGPCTITANNTVISGKTVNCDLTIRATGVVIKNSKVNGFVSTADGSKFSFQLVDSIVDGSPGGPRFLSAVGADNFTVLRSEIVGGNRGIMCRRNCEVRDSWIHGTEITGDWHASGMRASQGSRIIHNTISCDTQPTPQDGGCSADLTMYGDFEAVRDVHVEGNLFVANPTGTGFCTYGGSSPGKPYSAGAGNVVFINNVFARGTSRKCGAYGPVIHFDTTRPGNTWTNNRWDDGAAVPPSN